MKQAILIQCHKKPEQINLLLDALDDPSIDIFIHVDRKSDIISKIKTGDRINILPDEYAVRWRCSPPAGNRKGKSPYPPRGKELSALFLWR